MTFLSPRNSFLLLFDANEKTNRAARMKKEKILIYLSKILGFIIDAGCLWLSTRTTFTLNLSYGNVSTVPFSIPIYLRLPWDV
jgi:hypothetical protein